MTEPLPKPTDQFVELTADLVAAYVSNNPVPPAELPELIAQVYTSISSLSAPTEEVAVRPKPHIPIKKTVTPEYLISLEDGKQYRLLKRHLAGAGLTPDEYRMKWSLPTDYPMVAPAYTAKRSELAKKLGLGRKPLARTPAKRRNGKAKT
ncbi:MucR family transcriptional regulator [Aminobacter sp. DSM 101952]|uniref:MucR family transcriptional regulator n=1 Tax=Aminobacter sp. DSM 101952 TaxID=2735891 RepID=UPI0006FD92FB|nr:MucR family transcriptional regulator [Aminobacter sp. DSM 101952]